MRGQRPDALIVFPAILIGQSLVFFLMSSPAFFQVFFAYLSTAFQSCVAFLPTSFQPFLGVLINDLCHLFHALMNFLEAFLCRLLIIGKARRRGIGKEKSKEPTQDMHA